MRKETSADAVRQKYEDRLMRLPNVAGLGIGEKSGKIVIKVLVTRKVPKSLLKAREIVPEFLDGYETDVEEVGDITERMAN